VSQLRETQPTDHEVPSELLGPGDVAGPPIPVPRTMTPENTGDLPPGDFVTRGRGPTVYRTEQGPVHRIVWIDDEPAADVVVLRSDSGEHAVIVGTTVEQVAEPVTVTPRAPAPIGRPIGILGLAQAALDSLTEPGDEHDDLDGAQVVAARLARFGVRGVPGSAFMNPVVEHVLGMTGAERVYLADDGRALVICKFGVSALVPLPQSVADFVFEYDGPDLFPYPALYALPISWRAAS
jgi:hypothetical protein